MFDIISQVIIALFGVCAIWLVGRKERSWRKWGFIFGLASQPFWLYTTFTNFQWGMFTLSIFYTYAWWEGIKNNWIETPDNQEAS